MKKYKLGHKEEDKLTDQEISKYKDFGKVVTEYDNLKENLHRKPIYKNPRTFIFLVIVVILAYLISEVTHPDQDNPDAPVEQTEQP